MHPATTYFQQHLTEYPVDVLVQQLRVAGYDDATISAAWGEATQARPNPQAYATVATVAAGRNTIEVSAPVQLAGAARAAGSRTRTLIVALLVVAVAIAGGVLYVVNDSSGALPSKDDVQQELVDQGLDAEDAKAITDAIGGVEVRGKLPEGWQSGGEGRWFNGSTHSAVVAAVLDAPAGVTIDEIVDANVTTMRAGDYEIQDKVEDSRVVGHAARRIYGTYQGALVRQDYALVDGKLVVVSINVGSDREADREAAAQVASQLELA